MVSLSQLDTLQLRGEKFELSSFQKSRTISNASPNQRQIKFHQVFVLQALANVPAHLYKCFCRQLLMQQQQHIDQARPHFFER